MPNVIGSFILPIKLDNEKVELLMKKAEDKINLTINLQQQTIIVEDKTKSSFNFEIDAFRKKCLIEGLDDIGLTLKKIDQISEYENTIHNKYSWVI